jgi:hypothetical protein
LGVCSLIPKRYGSSENARYAQDSELPDLGRRTVKLCQLQSFIDFAAKDNSEPKKEVWPDRRSGLRGT